MPWLMGAAFTARTHIPVFMPPLRETVMEAWWPSPTTDHDRGERRLKRVFSPSKQYTWLGGTTSEALVPVAGTTP